MGDGRGDLSEIEQGFLDGAFCEDSAVLDHTPVMVLFAVLDLFNFAQKYIPMQRIPRRGTRCLLGGASSPPFMETRCKKMKRYSLPKEQKQPIFCRE